MNILFVGDKDYLSASIQERLNKEDHNVFVLGEKTDVKKKGFSLYHQYAWTESEDDIKRIFDSVVPDVVIYEGNGYLDEKWTGKQRVNLNRLSVVLEECTRFKKCQFILLSSVEVTQLDGATTENTKKVYEDNVKASILLQEEKIAEIYRENRGIELVILRLSQVFDNKVVVGADDWLGRIAKEITSASEVMIREQYLQPVHVSDVADAVVRILSGKNQAIYNICGSEQLAKSEVAKLVAEELCPDTIISVEKTDMESPYFSNNNIKEEKEWVEFWSWKKMATEKRFSYIRDRKAKEKNAKDKGRLKTGVRQTLENMIIFLFFCLAYFLTRNHSLFSQVDWLLIYVVVVSLAYGIKQSTFAVVLTSATYLLAQGTSILEMTNFYSYAESVLMIVEFLFFGIVVGYSADMLREEVRNCKGELAQVVNSYEKLKDINDTNVLLKNEYEKRVLDAKTSIPKLYSIINRITVLDINRIFMEILYVVEELMQTDTVAVYRVSENSSYLRLIASLNQDSVMGGSSWNLKEYPKIEQAIRQNELYEGDIWNNEPAIVQPIGSSKGCEAAIVIKKLPLESQSLYSINLLRTLLILIADSIDKALQHDDIVREQRYYKDTNILYSGEFRKAVALEEEKKQREMAASCIIRLQIEDDMLSTYHKAEKMFREMDIWGSDEEGNLYVLLTNTSEQDVEIVLERLKKIDITAEKLDDFR